MEDRPFERRTEIVLGRGALARVPALVGDRVFLVTDPGVVAAGHAARLEILLRDADAEVHAQLAHVGVSPFLAVHDLRKGAARGPTSHGEVPIPQF